MRLFFGRNDKFIRHFSKWKSNHSATLVPPCQQYQLNNIQRRCNALFWASALGVQRFPVSIPGRLYCCYDLLHPSVRKPPSMKPPHDPASSLLLSAQTLFRFTPGDFFPFLRQSWTEEGAGEGGGDWLDVFIHQYPYVLLAVRVSFRAPAVKTFSSSTFLSLVRKSIHLHLHALPRGCCVCLVPTSFYLMSHFSYEVKLKLKMSAVSAAICGMIEEPQTELKQEQVVISLTPWAASAFTVWEKLKVQ